jgi:hypothetical protein
MEVHDSILLSGFLWDRIKIGLSYCIKEQRIRNNNGIKTSKIEM